jgi:hypothetical protein
MPDKFTNEPIGVLPRYLRFDLPAQSVDPLSQLDRDPQTLRQMTNGLSLGLLPTPASQTNEDGLRREAF